MITYTCKLYGATGLSGTYSEEYVVTIQSEYDMTRRDIQRACIENIGQTDCVSFTPYELVGEECD